jgi:hypothetical protein
MKFDLSKLKSDTSKVLNRQDTYDVYHIEVHSERIKPLKIIPGYKRENVRSTVNYDGRWPKTTYIYHIATFSAVWREKAEACLEEIKKAGLNAYMTYHVRD